MSVVRARLDVVATLRASPGDPFTRAEACAFHLRKVIEGIAFGCLTAIDNGLSEVPRDARGQWSAETILTSLQRKKLNCFPSPSIIRNATDDERSAFGVNVVVEGVPERRLSPNQLVACYQETHRWLHELNPYVTRGRQSFLRSYGTDLWDMSDRINRFIERHFVSISGKGFFCVLRDSVDGQTKVAALSKSASLVD